MIKGITGGKYVMVQGGSTSDPYISPGSAGAGMMRWNPNMNCMEVNDGNMWKQMGTSFATITLDSEAEMLLDWAKKKKAEEARLDELCKKFPGLGKARDNYEVFKRLVEAEADISESVQSSP